MFGEVAVENVSLSAAFIAGLLSFFSPCVLPLVPSYFTFITGFSLDELTQDSGAAIRRKVFLSTLLFVVGFSTVFSFIGASASYLGVLVTQYQQQIRMVAGVLIIFFGIHVTGLFRFKLLEMEKRVHLVKRPTHVLGPLIIGMAFAAGWTPCLGPMMGTVAGMATLQETVWQGVGLMGLYSLGLALPFLAISVFIQFVLDFMRRTTRFIPVINAVAGILLIGLGFLLITNRLTTFI